MKKFGFATIIASGMVAGVLGFCCSFQQPGSSARPVDHPDRHLITTPGSDQIWLDFVNVPQVDTTVHLDAGHIQPEEGRPTGASSSYPNPLFPNQTASAGSEYGARAPERSEMLDTGSMADRNVLGGGLFRSLRHRTSHGLLPRRLLLDRTRGSSGFPHYLRGRYRGIPCNINARSATICRRPCRSTASPV